MRIIPPLLTSETAKAILEGDMIVSLDLGLSRSVVDFDCGRLQLPNGFSVSMEDLLKVAERENSVFFPGDGGLFMVAVSTERFFKLLPTRGAPTMEVDGVRMHRTKDTTPDRDTRDKLNVLRLKGGRVLDTCMGLGYTAGEAVKRGAELVVTVERESGVLHICALNPWSSLLYEPIVHKIIGDSYYAVEACPNGFFDWVIHDPPRITHAGHLYSGEFYRRIYRVTAEGGRLYHYTGEPGSRNRGVDIQKGVQRRLKEAGFRDTTYHKNVMAVTCEK